jgi:nicotinamidase-related amidase
MHSCEIPAAVVERFAALKGGVKTTVLDSSKTAHVVIDLQVGFLKPGARSEVPVAREIVPNVNRISQAVRAGGGVNVFIRFTVDPQEPHYWASMFDWMSEEARDAQAASFSAGAEEHALWPALDVAAEDWILDKTRLSAFIPGTCLLHDKLQAQGVDTLIVTGTLTNFCCESTVRDAFQMGYKVLFIQDGNATFDDAAHNATLANMLVFANVCTADEAIGQLEAAGAHQAAA